MVKPATSKRAERVPGPDPIDAEVGLNLRRARLDRGVSQSELGDSLGVSFQQIQKYERGANRMSASMLVKASRFLNVRAADLLPPNEKGEPSRAFVRQLAIAPGSTKAVEAYNAMTNPALRRAVLRLMRALGPGAQVPGEPALNEDDD